MLSCTARPGPPLQTAKVRLRKMSGILVFPDGNTVDVRDGLVIGRVAQCDVTIADTKASRRHARLVVQGTVVEIEDLGSSNGTFLNGSRVQRRVLRSGDEIAIGKTVLRFSDGAGAGAGHGDEPAAGEDLFGDVEGTGMPGADLEGDPRTGFVEPPPPSRPAAGSTPAARDGVTEGKPPAPADAPPPAAEEVEVLEFVDEVVEVRKAPPPPRTASPPRSTQARSAANRQGGVLQYQATARGKSGLLGDDLQQMSTPMRWGLVALAVAAAAGLGYGAMLLVS